MSEKIYGSAHRREVEHREFAQNDRQGKALRKLHENEAWNWTLEHGVSTTRPASGVDDEIELKWFRADGDRGLETVRRIRSKDSSVRVARLEELRLSSGQSAAPAAAQGFTHFQLEQSAPAGSAQSKLDRLHAEFDDLTRRRDALGQEILALRRRADLEHVKRTV